MNGKQHNLRERKPANPVDRTFQEDAVLRSSLPKGIASSGVSSGTSTPIPADAPPSVVATSSARKERRAEQRKRLFPTIDYEPRLSHFDPHSDYTDFRGFFVLFWIGLAIMVITTALRNIREFGYPLSMRQRATFTQNIWEMGISDLIMASSTALSLPLHLVYKNGPSFLHWDGLGMWIQSVGQLLWLIFWTSWPFVRDWTWTAQVFFTLHLLALFMKMHSYAFYNGHLSVTLRRLNELDKPSPTTDKKAAVKYPSSHTHLNELMQEEEEKDHERRSSVGQLRQELAEEVVSPLGGVTYPQNLTLWNYIDYLCCPTLCYEIEYPRTEKRSYLEIFYKTLAVFGCVFLLTVISDEFIIPTLDESAIRLQSQRNWQDGALIFAETVSRLLWPFMLIFLLVFLVIFEYLCGAFAEITRFADRQFYSDWWNSLDWLEFSREWNIPVHNFFRRHVYSASRTTMSRPVATFITFLISSLAHELVMGCITRKFRGYGFVAMMMQMPIVLVQRTPLVRQRKLLNNVLFWCSMVLGLSMICALR
ncbi:MBOAT-like protein 6 [Elsinoe fawcettii]|nr:MBOAT-like protein 6 [Elsinoe fawcettii]